MAPRSANSMKPVFISLLYSYTDSSVYARSLWRMWLALLDYQIFLFGGDTSGVSILLLFAICAVSEFLIISKEIKIAIVEWYMNVLSAFFLSMGICLIQIKVYWLIAWFIDSYFWICNTVELSACLARWHQLIQSDHQRWQLHTTEIASRVSYDCRRPCLRVWQWWNVKRLNLHGDVDMILPCVQPVGSILITCSLNSISSCSCSCSHWLQECPATPKTSVFTFSDRSTRRSRFF